MDPQPTAPPVVAVVVTHDAGSWLEEALAALGAQDYPSLSVLVIDTASADDPTPRVAAVLPNAFIRRLGTNPGYSRAANAALEMVEGAVFLVFCHDDAVPAPDAVRVLVDEAIRSNAGIVGPKLVDWDQPERLLQVGLMVDKTGVPAPLAERGELDQEQHDGVRDVFVVPGACTLVRADLFGELDGFDPSITVLGEDLDLCWRAQLAGARVMVAPNARVRHLEALPRRSGTDERRRLQGRHRLRTLLKCYGVFHLVRVLPQAGAATVAEAGYAVVAGERRHAGDVLSAWAWNLGRLGDLRRARAATQRLRRVPDSDVRRLQVRGSARLTAFVRGQLGGADRTQSFARTGRTFVDGLRRGPRRAGLALWTLVALVLLVGSRQLLAGRLPAVGELAPFPDRAGTFLGHFTSGWRFSGLGSAAFPPTAFGLLGVAGAILLGALGLLQKLLVLGALPVGAVGAWRLARHLGSHRARRVAPVVYLAVPLPYNALAHGRWSGLVAYAAAPFLLARLAGATRLVPFDGDPRPLRRLALGCGLLLAPAAALVPSMAPLLVAVALALAAGSLLVGGTLAGGRAVLLAVGAVAVAVVLCAPWSLGFLSGRSEWASFTGVGLPAARGLSLGRVLRFETGPLGAAPLGWAFLVAAALPLLIGRDWRLAWAVRLWIVAIACFGLAWAGGRGWLPVELPSPEVVLAPAALALALAAALGLVAFETDLPGYRFGWRQALSVVAAAAVVVGLLPVLGASLGGRWHLPHDDVPSSLAWMSDQRAAGDFRVLWLGDPDVLPLRGWRLQRGLAYGLTRNGGPSAVDLWPSPSRGATRLVASSVRLAWAGGTTRLGRLLAPMAVRYVVVPDRAVPAGAGARDDGGARHPVAAGLSRALAAQLDLRRRPSDKAVTVYENTAWVPARALLATPAPAGADPAGTADLAGARPVLRREASLGHYRGTTGAGPVLLSEAGSSRWRLRVDSRAATRARAFGWANGFRALEAGRGDLRYRSPLWRRALVFVQALLWLVVLRTVVQQRRRRGAGR